MKKCNRCKREKSELEFACNVKSRDGLQTWCKDCMKEYQSVYRATNQDKIREYNRKYFQRYCISSQEAIDKRACRVTTRKAIKNGELVRSTTCQCCSTPQGRIEAHHHDYTKPLDVTWLCVKCHRALHIEIRNLERIGDRIDALVVPDDMDLDTYMDLVRKTIEG